MEYLKSESRGPRSEGKPKAEGRLLSIWIVVVALAVGSASRPYQAGAQDINKGYTFSPNEKNVTHTKLNNLVDQATINTSFFTARSVVQPAAADTFLLYSSGAAGFRKTSFDTMFLSNTNLVYGQPEDTAPDTNAYFLEFNSDTGVLNKASLNSILTNALGSSQRVEITNPPPANLQFLVASNNVPYRIGESNIFWEWWKYEKFSTQAFSFSPPTNSSLLTFHTALTNADMIRVWDAKNGTNKVTTLAGLMTNMPTAAVLTNTDSLLLFATATNNANQWGTNPVISQVNLGGVLGWLTNSPTGNTNVGGLVFSNSVPWSFVTSNAVIGTSAGQLQFTNHSLPGTPQRVQAVIVCVANDAGSSYVIGDEIEASSADASGLQQFGWGANSTNVFMTFSGGTLTLQDKAAGTRHAVTSNNNFRAKVYATYFPR